MVEDLASLRLRHTVTTPCNILRLVFDLASMNTAPEAKVSMKTRKLNSPTAGEWILCALAMAVAAGLVVGMTFFAIEANQNSSLVNWFGLSTAIGGAFAFELMKYAVKVRDRHDSRLAMQVNLTPLKIEELRSVTQDVERTRELGAALDSAVELRARELFLQQQRDELAARVDKVKADLLDLASKEDRIARDQESQEASNLANEMAKVLKSLGVSREERLLDTIRPFYPRFPLGPLSANLIDAAVRYFLRVLEARQARRIRQTLTEDVGELVNQSNSRSDS
ncbi:MAG: hypothetical protein ACRDTC_20350 [Pseudonocardiaceae bacterium]